MLKHITYLILVLCITGCKHDDLEDFYGTSFCPTTVDFQFDQNLQVSTTDVDFTSENLTVTASFNEEVPWKVHIVGVNSGAEYMVEDTSSSVNFDWDGSSDNVYFFQNESCTVTLEIKCQDDQVHNINISATKVHSGILVSDFDGGGLVPNASYVFWDPGEEVFAGTESSMKTVQGTTYYTMSGNDALGPSLYYIGGFGLNLGSSFGLPAGADTVYYNAFVNGSGTAAYTAIVKESDGDVFSYQILIDWQGWKLLSIPYSDFNADNTSGGGIKNPENCNSTEVVLVANPAESQAVFHVDYIVFTTGEPFKP